MPTKATDAAAVERQQKMIKELRASGAVDFDRIGKLVAKVGPQVFDPGTVATDYVVSVGGSVLKVWEVGMEGALGKVEDLKKVSPAITTPVRPQVTIPSVKK